MQTLSGVGPTIYSATERVSSIPEIIDAASVNGASGIWFFQTFRALKDYIFYLESVNPAMADKFKSDLALTSQLLFGL